jgi:hypothetical protein
MPKHHQESLGTQMTNKDPDTCSSLFDKQSKNWVQITKGGTANDATIHTKTNIPQ